MDKFILSQFSKIFKKGKFDLPIRCKKEGYLYTLKEKLNLYLQYVNNNYSLQYKEVKKVVYMINNTMEKYLSGKQNDAFKAFGNLYEFLIGEHLLSIYSDIDLDPNLYGIDKHALYRIRKVNENVVYTRKDIFHIPFYLRNKITTNRYSIAGYPCLYLSSSIELCENELALEINPGRYIASRFEIKNKYNEDVRIIELGIKPQDFFNCAEEEKNRTYHKRLASINKKLLNNNKVMEEYIIWYPFIAACSFIRPDKSTPFSIEYVMPQLLMQYIREGVKINKNYPVYIGVRYFSCASVLASELGFNYAFPTNYENKTNDEYCGDLVKLFQLTKPIYINEYSEIKFLTLALKNKKLDDYDK